MVDFSKSQTKIAYTQCVPDIEKMKKTLALAKILVEKYASTKKRWLTANPPVEVDHKLYVEFTKLYEEIEHQ